MTKMLLPLLFFALLLGPAACVSPRFVAVFGDSLSDTGNFDTAYPHHLVPPYYDGRFCNGKDLLEYAALGVNPFGGDLSPYFRGLNGFTYNVNFAFGGSTATSDIISPEFTLAAPFYLGNQLTQFQAFTDIVNEGTHPCYPTRQQLDTALYFVFSGGNDINYANFFLNRTEDDILHSVIPHVTDTIAQAVSQLSSGGARDIVVVNLPPQGCCPYYLAQLREREGNGSSYDKLGCSIKYNNITKVYNQQLKHAVKATNATANLIFADYYGASLEIYNSPVTYGINKTTMLDACCARGQYYNCDTSSLVGCGCTADFECANPNSYPSWDGVHYTDGWNRQIAKLIFDREYGLKYLDPPNPLY